MANTIKKQQKRAMKAYLSKAAASVRVTQFPRIKDTGTLLPARLTQTKIVLNKGTKNAVLKKTKKKTVKKKK